MNYCKFVIFIFCICFFAQYFEFMDLNEKFEIKYVVKIAFFLLEFCL